MRKFQVQLSSRPVASPSKSKASPMPSAAPARDGQIAIQQEFDAALAAGTVAAWDLFIARHPGNPLTDRAEIERAKLLKAATAY